MKDYHRGDYFRQLIPQVLTTGFWPTYKVQDIDLPKEMLDSQAQFKVRTVLASFWSGDARNIGTQALCLSWPIYAHPHKQEMQFTEVGTRCALTSTFLILDSGVPACRPSTTTGPRTGGWRGSTAWAASRSRATLTRGPWRCCAPPAFTPPCCCNSTTVRARLLPALRPACCAWQQR